MVAETGKVWCGGGAARAGAGGEFGPRGPGDWAGAQRAAGPLPAGSAPRRARACSPVSSDCCLPDSDSDPLSLSQS